MEPQGTVKRWDPLRTLLIVAGCFALTCIGFFVAVLLGFSSPKSASVVSKQPMTSAQKYQVVDDLSSATASSSATTTRTTASATSSAGNAAQQADQGDTNASAKLQVLNSLNGSQ